MVSSVGPLRCLSEVLEHFPIRASLSPSAQIPLLPLSSSLWLHIFLELFARSLDGLDFPRFADEETRDLERSGDLLAAP